MAAPKAATWMRSAKSKLFLGLQPDDLTRAWLDLMIVCDLAFASPRLDRDELDAIGQEGWHRVYEALRSR